VNGRNGRNSGRAIGSQMWPPSRGEKKKSGVETRAGAGPFASGIHESCPRN